MVVSGLCINLGLAVGSYVGAGCNSHNVWYLRALLLDRPVVCSQPVGPGGQLAFHLGYLPGALALDFMVIYPAKDTDLFWSFL